MTGAPLLEVSNLSVEFRTRSGISLAVDGMALRLDMGETLAIVGESGCGKSVTALSILRLIASPPGHITSGIIAFDGRDLMALTEREMRCVRGNTIAMIFQEPMTSLNPVLTVGRQICEGLVLHKGLAQNEARDKALDMLNLVQIPDAERRLDQYPHELSGGMRQRVMIAMALACGPRLLIADEPTTALDVTIQAQILDIIRDLKARLGMATLLITHDLGVVAETADRVIVMYAGRKVEEGPVRAILRRPRHPYTLGLMQAVPRLGSSREGQGETRLAEITGLVPALSASPAACSFAPRCALAVAQCHSARPPMTDHGEGHFAACWRSADIGGLV